MARPEDVKYTETHEWVRAKKGEAVIGITDYAVKQLSDLVHIELPKVGESVDQGAPFGEIESVKTVADLVAPITGKITEVNSSLASNRDVLKDDPFEEGWIVKLKVSDPAELESLMTGKEYQAFIVSSESEEEEEPEEKKEGEEEVDEDDFM